MEPIKAKITYITEVIGIHPLEERKWIGGIGKDAEFTLVTIGWIITFGNGMQWRFDEKPNLELGSVTVSLAQ